MAGVEDLEEEQNEALKAGNGNVSRPPEAPPRLAWKVWAVEPGAIGRLRSSGQGLSY